MGRGARTPRQRHQFPSLRVGAHQHPEAPGAREVVNLELEAELAILGSRQGTDCAAGV